jgi:hypothetical protein
MMSTKTVGKKKYFAYKYYMSKSGATAALNQLKSYGGSAMVTETKEKRGPRAGKINYILWIETKKVKRGK